MSTLKINEYIVIKDILDGYELKGNITKVTRTPEIVTNVPIANINNPPVGIGSGNYIVSNKAGLEIIEVTLQITKANSGSPILGRTTGVIYYTINPDSDPDSSDLPYLIQEVEMGTTRTPDPTAIIRLVHNQEASVDPDNAVAISPVYTLFVTPAGEDEQEVILAKNANLILKSDDAEDFRMDVEVYKHSDADIFLNSILFPAVYLDFVVEQAYMKDGETYVESWIPEFTLEFALSHTVNHYVINNAGIATETVKYQFYSPFGVAVLRGFTEPVPEGLSAPAPAPVTSPIIQSGKCIYNNGYITKEQCDADDDFLWVPAHGSASGFCTFTGGIITQQDCDNTAWRTWIPEHDGTPAHCEYTSTPDDEDQCNAGATFIWIPEH